MRLPAVLFLCAIGLAACAPFPELDALAPGIGAPPQLLPMEEILARADTTSTDPGPALAARAARLKARASAIALTPASP
jgi:hypothetical protein